MRYVLSVLTKNPVVGVLAGALVTCVLQSSSAVTVMAIGFVSAGSIRDYHKQFPLFLVQISDNNDCAINCF